MIERKYVGKEPKLDAKLDSNGKEKKCIINSRLKYDCKRKEKGKEKPKRTEKTK